jgi:phage repressor protein C with HTH and peptisase S24 domain
MNEVQSIPAEYRITDLIASGFPIHQPTTLSDMRSEFGQRLLEARQHAKLTQGQFCKAVGISQSTLAGLEKTGQGSSHVALMAKVAGVRVDWLANGQGEMLEARGAQLPDEASSVPHEKFKYVWVVGKGSGGLLPDRLWTDGDHPVGITSEYAEVVSQDPHAFIVEVVGTSMVPRFNPGEFALIEPDTEPDLEDDVLVRLVTGQTMLKRLLSRRTGWRLGSYNNTEILHFTPEEVSWVYYAAYPVPARKIKNRV